jgi:hypothetical protein
MIKLGELKSGDIVHVNDEGVEREGVVVDVSHEDHKVQVDNGIQEFWYDPEQLSPIPLDENYLLKLGFEKEEVEGGGVKYKKGAFRLFIPVKGDFSHVEMWYREDRRHFNTPISVHQLQNLHHQMTKVPLEMPE